MAMSVLAASVSPALFASHLLLPFPAGRRSPHEEGPLPQRVQPYSRQVAVQGHVVVRLWLGPAAFPSSSSASPSPCSWSRPISPAGNTCTRCSAPSGPGPPTLLLLLLLLLMGRCFLHDAADQQSQDVPLGRQRPCKCIWARCSLCWSLLLACAFQIHPLLLLLWLLHGGPVQCQQQLPHHGPRARTRRLLARHLHTARHSTAVYGNVKTPRRSYRHGRIRTASHTFKP